MDKEAAIKWLEGSGFSVENITLKLDEPIKDQDHYLKLYKSSKGGSHSGEGFCVFMDDAYAEIKDAKGRLHPFDTELEDKIFDPDNDIWDKMN